jgi:hypothetical protein
MNISSDGHKRENDPPAAPRSVAAGIHEHLCEEATEAPRPAVQRGRPGPHRDRREALASARHHAFEMLLALVNAGEATQACDVGRPWALAREWAVTSAASNLRDWERITSPISPAVGREDPPSVEGETGRVVVADLRTPGTIDVGLLREQRDWLLSLASAASPAEVAQLVKVDSGHLDGLVNLLDAMLDSAEGYPMPGAGLARPAAGCAADCAVRAR